MLTRTLIFIYMLIFLELNFNEQEHVMQLLISTFLYVWNSIKKFILHLTDHLANSKPFFILSY